jgi:hypothetical protein
MLLSSRTSAQNVGVCKVRLRVRLKTLKCLKLRRESQ